MGLPPHAVKPVVMAGLQALCWIFMVCALAAPMVTVSIGPLECNYALFEADCAGAGGLVDYTACSDAKSHWQAVGAFGVLSMLAVCALLIFHAMFAVQAMKPEMVAPLAAILPKVSKLLVPIHAVVFFMLFLCWAIAAGAFSRELCGAKMSDSSDLGGAYAMFFLSWIIEGVLAALSFKEFGVHGAIENQIAAATDLTKVQPTKEDAKKEGEKPAEETGAKDAEAPAERAQEGEGEKKGENKLG